MSAAYPNGQIILNMEKSTTAIELCKIDGVSEETRREAGLNMTGGQVNAIEIATSMFKMPLLYDLLDALKKDIEEGKV